MRGYSNQVSFEVAPIEGEVRTLHGVPCTLRDGIYAGSRDGLTVTAFQNVAGLWVVRVDCSSTVLVDDLDSCAAVAGARRVVAGHRDRREGVMSRRYCVDCEGGCSGFCALEALPRGPLPAPSGMVTCPDCLGEGTHDVAQPWGTGDHIEERVERCETCDGHGEIDARDAAEAA